MTTTLRTRTQYDHALQALGVAISARIPVILWSDPGQGKTSLIESAAASGWLVEPVVASYSEPSDFNGLPVVRPDSSVVLAPPAWAKRLAEHDGPSILFLDEFSTSPVSVQNATLRMLTNHQVGALQLPETVAFVAASNPSDVSTGAFELSAPAASRFIHLDFSMPFEVYAEGLITQKWPTLPVHDLSAEQLAPFLDHEKVLVAGFLNARESQLTAIPKNAADRGRAFPTPRTWDYAARLSALAKAIGAPTEVRQLLTAGVIGDVAAHEFLAWTALNDLPDPEVLLADPKAASFADMRGDHVYVTLQGVLAAVSRNSTPARWTAAIEVCASAAGSGKSIDPAVPVVRTLLRPEHKPTGAAVPSSIKVFAPALQLAGLL